MRLPSSRWRRSFCGWLVEGLSLYLVLGIGLFLVLQFALKKTAAELACPFLACATPEPILLAVVWWLRRREEQGVSPKRLAREWGVSVTAWGAALVVAIAYAGARLGFLDPTDAVGGLIVTELVGIPTMYFTTYYAVIAGMSSKAAGKGDGLCRSGSPSAGDSNQSKK